MATTQLPVQGVFDKESGALLGFAVPGGSTVSAGGGGLVSRLRSAYARAAASNPLKNGVMASPPTVTPYGVMTGTVRTILLNAAGNSKFFRFRGAPVEVPQYVSTAAGYYQVRGIRASAAASYGFQLGGWSVTFVTNAPVFKPLLIGNAAGYRYQVAVNDQLTQAETSYYTLSTFDNSGTDQAGLLMDFGASSEWRTVTIYGNGDGGIAGVEIPEDYALAPVIGEVAPRLCVISDSYIAAGLSETSGVAFGAYPAQENMRSVAAHLSGWDLVPSAITGTGYVATNGAWATPEAMWDMRITDSVLTAPDAYVVALGYNDKDQQAATVTEKAKGMLGKLRAADPSKPVLVLGPWPGAENRSAALLATEAAIQSAVESFGDPLMRFQPLNNRPDYWLDGTRSQGTPTGGTAGMSRYLIGYDRIHLTRAGARHHAQRFVDDVMAGFGEIGL